MFTPPHKKILCVDDSEDNCEFCRIILAEVGYEVKFAHSMTDALQLIENSTFSLCLSNISLPNGTGFELLDTVRAVDASFASLPFIILSADARLLTQERAIQAGAQAFFPKPIDYDLLVATIDQLLNSIKAAIY